VKKISTLNIVHPNENVMIGTYACKEGLVRFFTHNGHFISYESINIKEHERNYETPYLELVAIVHALNMWRHNLIERKFELRKNHSGLKYDYEKPNWNARKTKWLEFLNEYEFDIKYITGKENKVVDALSIRVHILNDTTIGMKSSYFKRRILDDGVTPQHFP
jgi:hypothetical protein